MYQLLHLPYCGKSGSVDSSRNSKTVGNENKYIVYKIFTAGKHGVIF